MKSALHYSARRSENSRRNYLLLAPVRWRSENRFMDVVVDRNSHSRLVGALQRFRGQSYLEDGALRVNQLTPDGRHIQQADEDSWHLLVRGDEGEVIACARYYPLRDPRFESTVAAKSALARTPEWRSKVQRVVENSISKATQRGAQFAELGGWCVAKSSRNSCHALRSVLYMYALGELLGGTVGISTATMRHSSSSILQRLGAKKADLNGEVLPPYFEPMFDCEMELLQFDSRHPAPRYEAQIAQLREQMKSEIRVVSCQPPQPTCVSSLVGLWTAVGAAPSLRDALVPGTRMNAQSQLTIPSPLLQRQA